MPKFLDLIWFINKQGEEVEVSSFLDSKVEEANEILDDARRVLESAQDINIQNGPDNNGGISQKTWRAPNGDNDGNQNVNENYLDLNAEAKGFGSSAFGGIRYDYVRYKIYQEVTITIGSNVWSGDYYIDSTNSTKTFKIKNSSNNVELNLIGSDNNIVNQITDVNNVIYTIGYSLKTDKSLLTFTLNGTQADIVNLPYAGRTATSSDGAQSFAWGGSSHAKAKWSMAGGKDCIAYQAACVALGGSAEAGNSTGSADTLQMAFSMGEKTKATARCSTALGAFTQATGSYSIAAGYGSISSHTRSFTFGIGLASARNNQTLVGQYCNSSSLANAVFAVGIGADGSPSNGFVVEQSGKITFKGASIDGDGTGVFNGNLTCSYLNAKHIKLTQNTGAIIQQGSNGVYNVLSLRSSELCLGNPGWYSTTNKNPSLGIFNTKTKIMGPLGINVDNALSTNKESNSNVLVVKNAGKYEYNGTGSTSSASSYNWTNYSNSTQDTFIKVVNDYTSFRFGILGSGAVIEAPSLDINLNNGEGNVSVYIDESKNCVIETDKLSSAEITLGDNDITDVINNKIDNKISQLDVDSITGSTTKTITSISQTDGKIQATYSDISFPEATRLKMVAFRITEVNIGDSSIDLQPGDNLYVLATNGYFSGPGIPIYRFRDGDGPVTIDMHCLIFRNSVYDDLEYAITIPDAGTIGFFSGEYSAMTNYEYQSIFA